VQRQRRALVRADRSATQAGTKKFVFSFNAQQTKQQQATLTSPLQVLVAAPLVTRMK
jgi:hypothetical protein